MKAPAHLLLGAACGVLPDVLLLAYGWRTRWLEDTHPLVRAHAALHSPWAAPCVAGMVGGLAWASHVVADRYSAHRTAATRRGRFT